MTKLFNSYLICIIHIFIFFEWKVHANSTKAEDFKLEYIRDPGSSKDYAFSFSKDINGELHKNVELNLYGQTLMKDITVFGISINNDFLTANHSNSKLTMSIKKDGKFIDIVDENSPPRTLFPQDEFYKTRHPKFCTLNYCEIGISLNDDDDNIQKIEDKLNKTKNFYYIGFVKSDEYENLILKLIPKFDSDKNVFSIAFCPYETWISQNAMVNYILDKSNILVVLLSGPSLYNVFLKLSYCHNKGSNTFLKCGRIDQMFMPSIDVGYDCTTTTHEESYKIENENDKEENITVTSNNLFMCGGEDLLYSNNKIVGIIPAKNNYKTNSIIVNGYDNQFMYYSGQRIHMIALNKINTTDHSFFNFYGYSINYEPKCIVPEIYATLRLKVNGIIQKFENKVDEKLGEIDTYTIDKGDEKNISIGCHAVPDEMTFPQFDNFYEYRYQTSLMMLDGTTGKYISEINDIKSLKPNSIYKCVLSIQNTYPTNEKTNYIKETEFTIKLIESDFFIWIIFGVFASVSVLSIIGITIFIILKSKKDKYNNSSSTSTSLSTKKSSTPSTTSTAIGDVVNAPKLGYKPVYKVSKKIATKNPNMNLNINNYQNKYIPKKVISKISDESINLKLQDNVFKI